MSLQFEMERRLILFTANTTMPDNSLLGYEGNPNNITLPISAPFSAGKTLIYNCPQGTHYLELLNGTLWFKEAMPNYWASVANTQDLNSLSGYADNIDNKINSLSGAAVLIYNDQTISGSKDFASRPTVNTIPVALSGEASSSIEQLVKNDYGATLYKGQPVYVSDSNGNNILIRPASNSGERTSSKTFGLLKQTLLNNGQGYVVTEGPLFDVDTSMAAEGDPIWLGPTGNLIYGLINKPKAPQHLVYLGFVERAHQNQGKIFVKVQNGFELEELHNVRIVNEQNSDIIIYNSGSGLWLNSGVNFGSFAAANDLATTGAALQANIDSLSGVSVLTFGNQIINGTKYFNESVYIHDLYVTGTEFIANVQNNFIESPYILLNLTGGAIDGGIFFVTGAGLTGINDYGPIIGFDHSNKFKFGIARRSDDLSLLNDIAAVQDITNYSGFVSNNFYPLSNPSGFITGVDLSQYLTGVDLSQYVTKISGEFFDRPTVNGTGVLLSGEAAGTANFRYAPVTGVYNLLSNNRYSFDTLTGFVTGILPASPQKGDEIELYDSAGAWHLNPLIVDNNGNYIEQKKDMLQCNVRHGLIKLIYTTQNNIGWRIYPMPIHNVPLFLPPSIAITGAALSGIIPFYIALTGINLLDPSQAPVDEWYWNLNTGDGHTTSGQTIAYTYLQTGYYDVTLSGSNAAGFDVEHRFINVFLPYVPTVSITTSRLSGLAPFTGILNGTNTTQPAEYSPVDNWYWDFDGDQVFDFTGQNTTVVYNQTGTYTSTAYAVNLGGTGSGSIAINIIDPLVPIPAIATYTASGYAPLTIQFSGVNLQTPEEFSPVDHWYWNLSGDSAPEFDQRVISYTFNETGTYTFYLTATNSAGSGVASGIVTILEVPTDQYSDYVSLLLHFDN